MVLSWLFGRKQEKLVKREPGSVFEPIVDATRDEFSQPSRHQLVNGLIGDHRVIFEIWTGIADDFRGGNLQSVSEGLLAFKERLVPHVMMENTHLYKALARDNAENPEALALIKSMHIEMGGIGKAAVAFSKKYLGMERSPALVETFWADYTAVHAVLIDRIEREERDLYVLYPALTT